MSEPNDCNESLPEMYFGDPTSGIKAELLLSDDLFSNTESVTEAPGV